MTKLSDITILKYSIERGVVDRHKIYKWLHSKDRTLDELIQAWDFFKEHMVVSSCIIQDRIGKKENK